MKPPHVGFGKSTRIRCNRKSVEKGRIHSHGKSIPRTYIPDAIEKQKQTVKLEAFFSTVEIERESVKLALKPSWIVEFMKKLHLQSQYSARSLQGRLCVGAQYITNELRQKSTRTVYIPGVCGSGKIQNIVILIEIENHVINPTQIVVNNVLNEKDRILQEKEAELRRMQEIVGQMPGQNASARIEFYNMTIHFIY
ncbi:hypothetical protein CVS40_1840 [Lucilia cuprina]|nr:hypothetical protein CVS40_1840 [Lucilia cuprina]